MRMSTLDLSIVIPLFNEDESLPELTDWIARVMDREGFSYEIIFVNDGSTDNSWQVIQELSAKHPQVKEKVPA
jgi:glycosyltransferase involved in cell wall biosynthesis